MYKAVAWDHYHVLYWTDAGWVVDSVRDGPDADRRARELRAAGWWVELERTPLSE